MGIKEIVDEYDSEKEPKLEEIIKWFKGNDEPITISLIQREFEMGYTQATRALRQIKDKL